jgi:cobalt-precorrin 5A hydrolase/precorrin-3B C17-methyltransferase
MTARRIALVALTENGAALSRRLKPLLPGAEIHGLNGRVAAADHRFDRAAEHLALLFQAGVAIVGVCAAGILVRALAPHLGDKRSEPPVLALAEDGSVAVPLLGGHHGANDLAQKIAAALGGTAAITTAGELRFGLALDEPPAGWRIATPARIKPVTAALLAGAPVALRLEVGRADWLTRSGIDFDDRGDPGLRITDRIGPWGDALVYHPPVLALGIGCERGCDAEELNALVRDTLTRHGLADGAIALVASIDIKMDEPALHELGQTLGVPVRFFDAATLEAEAPRLATPSDLVFRETGCHGVAEGAALAAAGRAAVLVVAKTKSRCATCAVARAPADIDPGTAGRARGRLMVVGIGPGDAAWRTPEVSAALAAAEDVVGYGLYLDLIGDAIAGKPRHATGLGAEEARVRHALELAASGRRVALVSSGDAGIYALATLVFELIDHENRAAWNRVDIAVMPGVSAVQAAAARAGAPLGHDFCAISLSDLLTPWPEIARRVEAAAAGDFVVALYNPASLRRRHQFDEALAILRRARSEATPVVLARNLGRAGEKVEILPLSRLTVDMVDMLTLVVVGSSRTRLVERGGRRWVYTPRGYAAKAGAEQPGKVAPWP